MRICALALLIGLVLSGCASRSAADVWVEAQTQRLTAAGVTFPPEQGRNTVVNMVSACVIKKSGVDDMLNEQIWSTTTQQLQDWISSADAFAMWRLADAQFCASPTGLSGPDHTTARRVGA